MLREIRHQRDVAVRARRDDELLLEAREPRNRVGPRLQAMPCAIERVGLGLRQPRDSELDQDAVEIIRCSLSRLVQGSSPFRTRSMLGRYPARHASANAAPSTLRPFRFASVSISRATDVRQSTTVPKVSKTSAFTEANCGAVWPDASPAPSTATPACSTSRRVISLAPALVRRSARSGSSSFLRG